MRKGPRFGLPEYPVWAAMVQRCTNPNDKRWERYGGRGIRVCDRWLKFDNFYADMGPRPHRGQLDRIDNDAGYGPDNCRWASPQENAANKGVYRNSTTGHPGVNFRKDNKTFKVWVMANGKQVVVGHFKTLADAVAARALALNKPVAEAA